MWEIIESVADLKLSSEQRRRDFAFRFLLRVAPEIHRLLRASVWVELRARKQQVRSQQQGEQSNARTRITRQTGVAHRTTGCRGVKKQVAKAEALRNRQEAQFHHGKVCK